MKKIKKIIVLKSRQLGSPILIKAIVKEIAKKALLSELNHYDGIDAYSLKKVCADGRMGGGSSFGEWTYSIGNLYATTPKHPAKTIILDSGKKKIKFSIAEIYKELQDENSR